MNFKEIHIGQMIEKRVAETGIEISRICNFFKYDEDKIMEMYKAESLNTGILLKWSKLLEYDFFRIYTQHLILYAPPSAKQDEHDEHSRLQLKQTSLPEFRKNIYTKEIVDFIIEQISTGEMSKNEIMERYRIPKTTLYKWISKYRVGGY